MSCQALRPKAASEAWSLEPYLHECNNVSALVNADRTLYDCHARLSGPKLPVSPAHRLRCCLQCCQTVASSGQLCVGFTLVNENCLLFHNLKELYAHGKHYEMRLT